MRRMCLIILVLMPALVAAQAGRKQVFEGNKLFGEEKYDAASGKYHDALLDAPENPIVQYNLGSTEYKTGKYEEALENYGKAMGTRLAVDRSSEEEILRRSQVHYNRGNVYYRLNKSQEAIQEYREALRLNPDDEDSKYNLEFVRNKIKNDAQQQNQDQNQQQDQQKKQDQQQQDQQKQQQQQEQQEQNQQDQQKKDDEQQQKQEQQAQMADGKMSKEDAQRLLDALKDDEKEEQAKRKVKVPVRGRRLKDW